MADFTIKQFDTLPQILAILRVGGAIIDDLADAAEVRLVLAKRSDPSTYVFSKVGVIVDAPTGKVAYNWVTGDTNIADEYVGEWHILYLDGSKRKVPTVGKFTLSIEAALPES